MKRHPVKQRITNNEPRSVIVDTILSTFFLFEPMRILTHLFVSGILFLSWGFAHGAESWHFSFANSGGGYWQERTPVEIENNSSTDLAGFPVYVPIPGDTTRGFPRVVCEDGTELLYGLVPDRKPNSYTAIRIPVEILKGQKARYFIYTVNDRDGFSGEELPVMERFNRRDRVENGGFDIAVTPKNGGEPLVPGWKLDESDEQHRIMYSTDHLRQVSGAKNRRNVCVQVQPGAEPSWIAARQTEISLIPGVKYRLSAWVRGENIVGRVGVYAHAGPEGKSFVISPMASMDEKKFDWKQVQTEFVVPENATVGSLGTVLRGTGTAWFDDLTLEMVDTKIPVNVQLGPKETCPLKLFSAKENAAWPKGYRTRSTFRIVHQSSEPIESPTILFDLNASFSHAIPGDLRDVLIEFPGSSKRIPARVMDAVTRQVQATLPTIPGNSISLINVYYKFSEQANKADRSAKAAGIERTAHPELQMQAELFAGIPNLLKNGDLESDPTKSAEFGWIGDSEVERDPAIVRFGKACARLKMRPEDEGKWRGYRQRIPVQPGRNYLVSGYLRCQDHSGGSRIHIHFNRQDGSPCQNGGFTSVTKDIRGDQDWTRCSQLFIAPNDAATMTVHLTSSHSGTIWHDNISVIDSLSAAYVDSESRVESGPVAWQLPSVMKVFPQAVPPTKPASLVRAGAARNEKESVQIAVRGFTEPSMSVSPLVNKQGQRLPTPEIHVVGYVPCDYPTNYYNIQNVPAWVRRFPSSTPACDGWVGLWPDPLIEGSQIGQVLQNPNGANAFWLTWSIPKNCSSGLYQGKIMIRGKNSAKETLELPIELNVYDFTLPDQHNVSAIYDARFSGGAGAWGKDVYHKAVELMTEHRLAPDRAWPDVKLEFQDGKPVFDWTEFDRTVEWLLTQRKVRVLYMPGTFYMFGWGHPPKNFYGEKPYEGEWPFKNADFSKLRPEYKAKYQSALRLFQNHLKEKGWADRFVLYISDEPNHWLKPIKDQMIALCDMIHEVDPEIKIYCSTWGYVPEWLNALDVWGIGHYGIVAPETMKMLREHGSRIWFTTDGMQCLDTPYSAIERLLPYYCFKYDADAYEFWGVGWLTRDPWRYGSHDFIWQSSTPGEHYWVRYPNGDGYLLYPPVNNQVARYSNISGPQTEKDAVLRSIRFEQARKGVEDYEYLFLLRALLKAKPNHASAKQAQAALDEMVNLVECPCEIGRYSTRILPNPMEIDRLREQVARAIEALQK